MKINKIRYILIGLIFAFLCPTAVAEEKTIVDAEIAAVKGEYTAAYIIAFRLYQAAKDPQSKKEMAALYQYYVARGKLQTNPKDANSRAKCLTYLVVEKDNLKEAQGLLTEDVWEVWNTYIPLAIKPLAEIDAVASWELANWYNELMSKSVNPTVCKQRSILYLQHFLTLHTKDDKQKQLAELMLIKLVEKGKLTLGENGEWVDLLKLIDVKKHAIHGSWKIINSELHGSYGTSSKGAIVIPVMPQGDYELSIGFTRVKGGNQIRILLPVGSGEASMSIANLGKYYGLTLVDKKDISKNGTRKLGMKILNGHNHSLKFTVHLKNDMADIAVYFDDKKTLEWKGKQLSLSIPTAGFCAFPLKGRLGLVNYDHFIFTEIKLRMLSGELKNATEK